MSCFIITSFANKIILRLLNRWCLMLERRQSILIFLSHFGNYFISIGTIPYFRINIVLRLNYFRTWCCSQKWNWHYKLKLRLFFYDEITLISGFSIVSEFRCMSMHIIYSDIRYGLVENDKNIIQNAFAHKVVIKSL